MVAEVSDVRSSIDHDNPSPANATFKDSTVSAANARNGVIHIITSGGDFLPAWPSSIISIAGPSAAARVFPVARNAENLTISFGNVNGIRVAF